MSPRMDQVTRRNFLAATAATGVAAAAPIAHRARLWFVDSLIGNDDADGTTPATAWRTLPRAARANLAPGDQLLLAGGHPHVGPLHLRASGTAARPIVVGSYGRDRAVINGGDGNGFVWRNAGGIVVRDLDIRGNGVSNRGCGLLIENSRGARDRRTYVRIEGVRAAGFSTGRGDPRSGFEGCGIFVGGTAVQKCGFADVSITDCEVTDNGLCGLMVSSLGGTAADSYANADVRIVGCRAWNNPGLPHYIKNWSGSGILMENTERGVIAHCAAWENGRLNPAAAPGGPVGIWTHASRKITIEYNHSYLNNSGGYDGGGFDFDASVQDSVLRHNYSHDNRGAGYLIYSYKGSEAVSTNLRIEDNISIRDGMNMNYAGLWLRTDGPAIEDVVFARNVVVAAPRQIGVRIDTRGPLARIRFEHNVITPAGGRGWLIEGPRTQLSFDPALPPGEGAPPEVPAG